jgi:hypothetical protein
MNPAPYIQRRDGWLLRWQVITPTGGIDLSTEHITRLGALWHLKFWHGM